MLLTEKYRWFFYHYGHHHYHRPMVPTCPRRVSSHLAKENGLVRVASSSCSSRESRRLWELAYSHTHTLDNFIIVVLSLLCCCCCQWWCCCYWCLPHHTALLSSAKHHRSKRFASPFQSSQPHHYHLRELSFWPAADSRFSTGSCTKVKDNRAILYR